jgi:hypothetical protein
MHFSAVDGVFSEYFLDPEELIVLGHPVGPGK